MGLMRMSIKNGDQTFASLVPSFEERLLEPFLHRFVYTIHDSDDKNVTQGIIFSCTYDFHLLLQ